MGVPGRPSGKVPLNQGLRRCDGVGQPEAEVTKLFSAKSSVSGWREDWHLPASSWAHHYFRGLWDGGESPCGPGAQLDPGSTPALPLSSRVTSGKARASVSPCIKRHSHVPPRAVVKRHETTYQDAGAASGLA